MLVARLFLALSISCEDREVPFFQNVGESLPDYRASYLKRFINTHLSNRDWRYSAFKKIIYLLIQKEHVGKECVLLGIIALSKEATRE
jgi:hypothetical protein